MVTGTNFVKMVTGTNFDRPAPRQELAQDIGVGHRFSREAE